ncbi:glutaredoxin family protein [Heyndrickxia oleronia]|uniref:NrdH-redoxin n=1 Tax=Heyndrickxia oleronia TaxID=38875 RepID=A0A8E2LFE4_9BACI|nr:glutaredoxin family protein [Heyndrickxia oleronia]NYV66876.1 glutaredoxin family protein [Bacillus sp. Gen3]OJH16797.1 NrdH-redoxin [Bacillus obstructivus]MBU5213977.1 glutaredoxin family protein [Heyndrickxia oleronia]MCI1591113.1 glutaredoxin family protein [Heyndrickxia oleronia]MCI1614661.1 glutaredoxin family protein [Heyndrickxia oleronia]
MEPVTVYTTNQCVYCVMLKNFLLDQNIPFKEINVDQNPRIVQKLIDMTGKMGVPQIEINGKWVVGYDPNQIMKAFEN